MVAPLTALLVVQVTLFSTLTAGLQRIGAVVAGVVVAVLFSDWVALSWWSLAVVISAAIIVGQLLRLREHLLEVPISAMLVLAVGGTEPKAEARIVETLIGAAVGILYTFALPGPVQSRTAGQNIEEFAARMARLLRRMAGELGDGVTTDRAQGWLDEARDLSRRVSRVDLSLVHAEQSRRLNVRALGTVDPAPLLRSGLDALEHSAVALRSLCRAVLETAGDVPAGNDGYPPDVREVLAVLLGDLAAAVEAFGALVRGEAEGVVAEQDRRLAAALEAVREARVRLTELLLVDRSDDAAWEQHGVLLSSVQRMLAEVDVEERVRQRRHREQLAQQRPPAAQAVGRLRATSREVVQPVARRRRRRVPDRRG